MKLNTCCIKYHVSHKNRPWKIYMKFQFDSFKGSTLNKVSSFSYATMQKEKMDWLSLIHFRDKISNINSHAEPFFCNFCVQWLTTYTQSNSKLGWSGTEVYVFSPITSKLSCQMNLTFGRLQWLHAKSYLQLQLSYKDICIFLSVAIFTSWLLKMAATVMTAEFGTIH